jgi:glycerate 2-kinase
VERWRDIGELVVRAALDAANAGQALRRVWEPIDDGSLLILSIGKASVEMAAAAGDLLADRAFEGIVTAVPERMLRALDARWRVFPCDHPLATQRNLGAAAYIESRVRGFAENHAGHGQLLVLISGGGSAHLTLPAKGVSLAEYVELQRRLMLAGASINELNAVRKHAERLKGGRLAVLANSLRVRALVMSDVIGDPLDVIASGPLSPDPSTFADAIQVITRRGCHGMAPGADEVLERGMRGQVTETPKPGDSIFDHIDSQIIASNAAAVDAVAAALQSRYKIAQRRTGVTGEARDVARELVDAIAAEVESNQVPICIVWGGEPTVAVGQAKGRGGPSQEVALAAAIELERRRIDDARVVSFSTDGVDGPTSNAGGIGDAALCRELRAMGRDPVTMLGAHDSAAALELGRRLIRTGPTGTNVNHVFVAIAGV